MAEPAVMEIRIVDDGLPLGSPLQSGPVLTPSQPIAPQAAATRPPTPPAPTPSPGPPTWEQPRQSHRDELPDEPLLPRRRRPRDPAPPAPEPQPSRPLPPVPPQPTFVGYNQGPPRVVPPSGIEFMPPPGAIARITPQQRGEMERVGPAPLSTKERIGPETKDLALQAVTTGAAAAAGPIGPVIAALGFIARNSNEVTTALQDLRSEVNSAGRGFSAFAQNDHIGMLNSAVDGAATAVNRIPVFGKPAAAGLRLFGDSINEANEVVHSFIERGKELQGYSSELAQANARANLRRIEADIREGRSSGRDLARITEAQSRLETNARDSLQPLKDSIADGVGTIVQAVEQGFAFYKPIIDLEIAKWSGLIRGVMLPLKSITEGINALRGQEGGADAPGKLNAAARELFESVMNLPLNNVPHDPAEHAKSQQLAAPILNFGNSGGDW